MTLSATLGERLVDGVVAVMALEFVVLSWRRGWRLDDVLSLALALAPGVFLVLALRLAMANAGFAWVGLCLALALPFHLADLSRRGFLKREQKAGEE